MKTKSEHQEISVPVGPKVAQKAAVGRATFNCKIVKPRYPNRPVVYFVRAVNGLIKIGSTKYFDSRFQSLQNGSPVELTVLVTIGGDRTKEFTYHSRFAEHRLHGEWFSPHPDILAEIERIQKNKASRARKEVA